jgi:dihydrofolate synthase
MRGIELGLERISALLDLLGNPQNNFKAVHIAGTNGKGSVTLTIASVLVQSKLRTASFTSPHLLVERDCIRIDGKCVEFSVYEDCRKIVLECGKMHNINVYPFEILTATAFLIFSRLRVDIAIVEVGLGGRLDATNVLPPPLVAILCKIALDHTEFLGSTIESIASHKAGILKRGTKYCVVSQQSYPEAIAIFMEEAARQGVKMLFSTIALLSEGCADITVEFPTGQRLKTTPRLIGSYQLENLAAACKALSLLKEEYDFPITDESLKAGVSLVRNPGRLEWIDSPVYGKILLDGSHNEDGVAALTQYISTIRRKGENITFIVGFSGKKPADKWIKLLCRSADIVYPVSFTQPEGMHWIQYMDPIGILERGQPYARDCQGSLQKALQMIDRNLTEHVVVCGSLYLVADFYRVANLSF